MATVLFDAVERARLCDQFEEIGPEAPTLLEPWTTRDLAAHLVLREHDHSAGPGLELQWAGTAQTVRARRGEPTARIAGSPGELLLYLFGRQDVAQVEVSGPASAVEAVRRARFGM